MRIRPTGSKVKNPAVWICGNKEMKYEKGSVNHTDNDGVDTPIPGAGTGGTVRQRYKKHNGATKAGEIFDISK